MEANTTTGSGLSMGTHLLLENLFSDKLSKISEEDDNLIYRYKLEANDYDYHVINIFTILRNILSDKEGSRIEDKIKYLKEYKSLKNEIINEILLISSLYSDVKLKPIIVLPDYKKAITAFNNGKKEDKRKIWLLFLFMDEYLRRTFRDDLAKYDIEKTNHILWGNLNTLSGKEVKILFTTNISIDLFNKGNFDVLESYSGKLLNRLSYGKKYHKIGDADIINYPFIPELYYILGGNFIITPMDIKFRLEIKNLAIKNKWSPKTTTMKINYDINSSNVTKGILNRFRNPY